MEEYCDDCGGRCDGVHSERISHDEHKKREVEAIVRMIRSKGFEKEIYEKLQEVLNTASSFGTKQVASFGTKQPPKSS